MGRKAAERASAEDVAELRAIVEQQRAVTGDAAAFVHADMGFHTRIAQITGNPIYSAVSEGMLGWLQEYHAHMLIWQGQSRSEEHTSELQSLMRISYAVFCLKKKTRNKQHW